MRFGLVCFVVAALVAAGCKGKEDVSAGSGPFAQVGAILAAKCARCHGAMGPPKAGIDLQTYASVMKGGKKGPIVVAGDPDGSVIVQALRGKNGKKQMPLRKAPLSEEEIQKIEAWIKDGAKG